MKLMTAIVVLLLSLNVFAGEPKAAVFGDLAKSTVKSLYGRKGDTVSMSLTAMNHSDSALTETWEVTLSNKLDVGSAIYQISVTQKNAGVTAGDDVATIKVKYIDGN